MSYPLPPRNRRSLDDYAIDEELGVGSLSKVYAATERATGKLVAVKMFDRAFLRSQHKEADVTMEEHCMRRANHPGIAKLQASFSDAGMRYLVLEFCSGGELWTIVKDIGCPDRLARHYFSQIVEAVSYLHDAGIVHRDLKAENVLIGAGGVAKLIDFGSAKDLANPHIKGAGTWSFNKAQEDNVGTPNFMAPEAINNKRTDFRSDIWSLGCLFFQVLSGFPPFGQDLLRVYERALESRLRFPPGITADAEDLISSMVRIHPRARLGATDLQDISAHQYFAGVPCDGLRFEGAHRRSAPVPSLGDCCLRTIGRHWGDLGGRASSWIAMHRSDVDLGVAAVLARYRRVASVRARRDARPQLTNFKEHWDSGASTADEAG